MINRNAATNRRGGGHKGGWHPVDRAEMQAFIGLIIATGITRLLRLAMYWETGHPLTGTPGFSNVMSRDRFLQLLRYLHANDESLGNADNDKLYKVRDFTNRINRNFSNNYSMGCDISIDESLIPFKGRLGFKQFIPSKRARFGIKCWVLADASNSFVSRFCVYTGRQANVEGMCISKGVNSVISLLDHFFANHGIGEKKVYLHCDNCSGQNQNNYLLWYLAWRVMHSLHLSMSPNFLIKGHIKFGPDWCFGLIKQNYRRHIVSCLLDCR